jgi:hypothetical protein
MTNIDEYKVSVGTLKGMDHLGHAGINGRIILIDFNVIRYETADWILLAQNRVQWQALMNTLMNIWVPYKVGSILTTWETLQFSRKTPLLGVSSFH